MITLTLDQTIRLILDRGADVRLVDGRLRYRGPKLAPDDPLAVALAAHRDALVRLLTPAPRPTPRFEPGPPYFEPVPGQPNAWRETAWSRARCIYGDDELAPGDLLHCRAHAASVAAERSEPAARAVEASDEGRAA